MRPSSVVLVSLLALSLLFTGAQGIRFKIGLLSFGQDQPAEIHELEKMSTMMKTSNHEDGSSVGGQSITGIMNRKLITTTNSKINEKIEETNANPRSLSSSSPSSKSKSSDHGERNLGTNSPPPPPPTTSGHSSDYDEISQEHYHVDITDITEMDYSPARRKPPIHN
ncbi:hypothetical protein ACOSP7_012346 [Xanthoceras sorbifolium]|uniref:Uncharacterized protein n=1 Tax=Xanthoceras sorbifolium TaxID=99658 RepID=A0ABQ8HXN3_9ROSI|nr:hypothetical protein JRO89_XS06G0109600 [Xanthoceras sorbifolium]